LSNKATKVYCLFIQLFVGRHSGMRKLSGRSHRRIRPARKKILGSEELARHFDVEVKNLESHLKGENIPYHKDSKGDLWASVLATGLT
jgi:hypothetical protein